MTQKNAPMPQKQGKTGILPLQAVTTTGEYQESSQINKRCDKKETCLAQVSFLYRGTIFCVLLEFMRGVWYNRDSKFFGGRYAENIHPFF